ncbi:MULTISPECIES: FRG domain-containing protein [Pseudomonas]|uniref:FRG domain-containing protein n=1 Tax=Pseudomonas TaxID=286 RepID=UPI001071246D|nr:MULTISPECIES: FRG domain-containing protein [Pseudomonas]QBR32938.1 FRG domain-containing protein [Pseudomonas sp. S150]UZT91122.1 FRG domain-containing protein [Pseudomonas koreensis]
MTTFIKERRFGSAQDFLNAFMPWAEDAGLEGFIFRGHSNSNYELVPTSLRCGGAQELWKSSNAYLKYDGSISDDAYSLAYVEYQLIRDFYRMADARGLDVPSSDRLRKRLHQNTDLHTMAAWLDGDEWLPSDMLETAGLAQHYGISTRLLDWTYNPFVASFFASKSCVNSDGDLCIWAMNAKELGLIEHVEKDFPLKMITPHYSGNPNLAAQNGLFTHWSVKLPSIETFTLGPNSAPPVDRRSLDVLINEYVAGLVDGRHEKLFVKMVLPRSETVSLAQSIRKLGYGPSRIFPGYDGVAAELKERHLLKRHIKNHIIK